MSIKEFYLKTMETFYVHILWVLTIVFGLMITFGAATKALDRVMFQIYNKDEPTPVFSLFIKSFKDDFLISTGVWFLIIIFGVPIVYMLYYAVIHNNVALMIIGILASYQILMFLFYSFAVMAIFETDNFFKLLKNIFLMQSRFIFSNVKILGNFAIIVFIALLTRIELIYIVLLVYGFITTFYLRKPFELIKQNVIKENV